VVSCLRRLFRAVHEYSKALHRRAGLSSPQLWALHLLQLESGLSLKTLSARMFAHPSTVSGVVARLNERGLVLREIDGADRRGIRLRLTPRGLRVLRGAPPPLQVGLRQALEEMPAARLRELRRSLEEIARKAEVTDVVAPFFD
jgi:DNA-binding MarR family transcriptional regulator